LTLNAYLNLFPPSSLAMPRFASLATVVLQQAADLQALIPDLESGFSVGDATGAQLDALGESVGVPRSSGMTDADYRQLLSMKFDLWGWDGTNETVPALVATMMTGASQVDHGNLSVTVSIPSPLPFEPEEVFPIPPGIHVITQ
jgi:hypothetical protein